MGDDETTIGRGGWALVVLAGVITFGVLRGLMHYDIVPAMLFSAAIALVVLLLLYRLAQAVNRYEDEEEARKVRKLVPASSEMGMRMGDGPTIPAAVAVPVRAETSVTPVRPSSVVRPLADVASPPVILADPVVDPAPVTAPQPVAPPPAAMPVAAPKTKAAAKPKADKPKAEPKPKASKAAKPNAAKSGEPKGLVRLKAPRKGKADDLQEIEGIGPALEKLVNSLGFYHFDQIAAWTEADVALVDAEMKTFKGRITRDRWVEQAKIIVGEGLEAFRERAKTNDY